MDDSRSADNEQWLAHAARGDFAAAWAISDRALARHAAAPDFQRPRHLQSIWKGEPLEDKRVLIRCYHGLGDTIQFIRFAPMVRAVAREVLVWAPEPLLPLLGSVEGIDAALPLHEGAPDLEYDADVEVMELPYVFRTTLDTVPGRTPYMSAPPATLPASPPRVGIFWRGGEWDRGRWVPFREMKRLLEIGGVTWCSLQPDDRADEAHPRLLPLGNGSLADLAGRVAGLDLVITIDSMPAHLAGALGVPVWTLLQEHADWRWMQHRSDTPWYPTMRLFRQEADGCWGGVVDRVVAALSSSESNSCLCP